MAITLLILQLLLNNVGYGGNNQPGQRSEYISVKLPVTPSYLAMVHIIIYNKFDSTEKSYTGATGDKNLEQVAMQMYNMFIRRILLQHIN